MWKVKNFILILLRRYDIGVKAGTFCIDTTRVPGRTLHVLMGLDFMRTWETGKSNFLIVQLKYEVIPKTWFLCSKCLFCVWNVAMYFTDMRWRAHQKLNTKQQQIFKSKLFKTEKKWCHTSILLRKMDVWHNLLSLKKLQKVNSHKWETILPQIHFRTKDRCVAPTPYILHHILFLILAVLYLGHQHSIILQHGLIQWEGGEVIMHAFKEIHHKIKVWTKFLLIMWFRTIWMTFKFVHCFVLGCIRLNGRLVRTFFRAWHLFHVKQSSLYHAATH